MMHWVRERHRQAQETRSHADFPLDLTIQQPSYYRYGLVKISLVLTDVNGKMIRAETPPKIIVRDTKMDIVTTVGGVDKLVPKFEASEGRYVCYWPIPWNAAPGRYIVEAQVEMEKPQQWEWIAPGQRKKKRGRGQEEGEEPAVEGQAFCVVREPFDVVARRRRKIEPGMCVATWEPDFPGGQIMRPDGTKGDWRAMLDWAQYIGADTFWFRGGVTTAYNSSQALSFDQPWVKRNIEALAALGDEAHRRGLKFGAWAVAYETYPNKPTPALPDPNMYKPPYRFAKDISRSSGKVSDTCWVSLLDEERARHLQEFFEYLQALPQVDYIGLDYMRVERAYEMTERFASQMPVQLPDDWDSRSQKSKWLYVAKKVETEWNQASGRDFYDCWNWWRSHLAAEILAGIINQGKITKPVWIFTLGWKTGHQHGQDVVMFHDAGAALLAPMLYQCDSYEHFDFLINDWRQYLQPGEVNLLPGDEVSDYWHKREGNIRSRRPAAPEVMYQRMVRAYEEMMPGMPAVGLFWHDISRAASLGKNPGAGKGPYPGIEWALAGGAAFSKAREGWQVYPITAQIRVPSQAVIGVPFEVRVRIKNRVKRAVANIDIELQPTPQIGAVGKSKKRVKSLGPGEEISVPFEVKITSGNAKRANRFMVAARITWPHGKYGPRVREDLPRVIIVMKYLDGK